MSERRPWRSYDSMMLSMSRIIPVSRETTLSTRVLGFALKRFDILVTP